MLNSVKFDELRLQELEMKKLMEQRRREKEEEKLAR